MIFPFEKLRISINIKNLLRKQILLKRTIQSNTAAPATYAMGSFCGILIPASLIYQ